jgi:hypothetical protein
MANNIGIGMMIEIRIISNSSDDKDLVRHSKRHLDAQSRSHVSGGGLMHGGGGFDKTSAPPPSTMDHIRPVLDVLADSKTEWMVVQDRFNRG